MAEMMDTKYGVPWFKVNFIGAVGLGQVTEEDRADYFGDAALIARVEKVIAEGNGGLSRIQAT